MSDFNFDISMAAVAEFNQDHDDDDHVDIPEEPVMEPHEHDVLCGRGGLSNHHAGNAWFRRLVRSNRPLYRASPKHTKLLVAKAIVHHVQAQNPPGRFLECNRKSGLWFPVSYKRAVDKTSQALRERDRDNEGIHDTKPTSLKHAPKPPNLAEMTETAMSAGASRERKRKQAPQHEAAAALMPSLAQEPIPPQPELKQSSSWFWRRNKKQKTESSPDDPVPLPTQPLVERASSIFRFFQSSKVFGDAKSQENAGEENASLMNSFDSDFGNQGIPQQHPNGLSGFAASQFLEPDPISASGITVESIEPLPLNKKPASTSPTPPEAPALTRLTTQVSDWLQSFWPLGDGERVRNTMIQAQQQQLQQQQQQLQQQILNQQTMFSNNQDMASLQGNIANLANIQRQLAQQSAATSNDIIANQVQFQMQQLQQNMQSQSSIQMNHLRGSVAAPPALNPSVSSTLLQLATSPSRLLSGLSSFFSERKTTVIGNDMSNIDGGRRGLTNASGMMMPQSMMESNNSASLMPAPMGLGGGTPSLAMATSGGFGMSLQNMATTTSGDQPRPQLLGKKISGRSLLDDDDD
jgi:hypothetical protein